MEQPTKSSTYRPNKQNWKEQTKGLPPKIGRMPSLGVERLQWFDSKDTRKNQPGHEIDWKVLPVQKHTKVSQHIVQCYETSQFCEIGQCWKIGNCHKTIQIALEAKTSDQIIGFFEIAQRHYVIQSCGSSQQAKVAQNLKTGNHQWFTGCSKGKTEVKFTSERKRQAWR